MRLFLALTFIFTAFSAQAIVTSPTFLFNADYVRLGCSYSYEIQSSDKRVTERFNMFARTTSSGKLKFAYHQKNIPSYYFEIGDDFFPRGVWHNDAEFFFGAILEHNRLTYSFALKNYYRNKSKLEVIRQEERRLDVYSLYNYGYTHFNYTDGERTGLDVKSGAWVNRESVRIEGCTIESFNARHNPVIAIEPEQDLLPQNT